MNNNYKKLFDKNKPMKIKHTYTERFGVPLGKFNCPRCGAGMEIKYSKCPSCGQSLA